MPPGLTNWLQATKDANRKASQNKRPGIVYEVRKGKCRILLGQGPNGEPYLSPWLWPDQHMGGSRKSQYIKKNMNVMVHLPNGDPAQAYFTPLSPNDEIPRPDHAEEAGEEADTYQLETLRSRQDKDTWDWWITPESGNGQVTPSQPMTAGAPTTAAGSSGQQQTPPVGKYKARDTTCGKGTKSVMKVRMNKDGGFTARVDGTDIRVSAYPGGGAKIRTKNHWLVVTNDDVICSKPPQVKDDPVANDDE